jgi:transposase InsO family protein
MTEELQELGLRVGHRRVGRLMRENGIKIVRTHKYKATTIARQAIAKLSAERGTATTRSTSRPTYWIRISQPPLGPPALHDPAGQWSVTA